MSESGYESFVFLSHMHKNATVRRDLCRRLHASVRKLLIRTWTMLAEKRLVLREKEREKCKRLPLH